MANDFEWDYNAAGELMLRSPEIAAICESEAARLTRATGMEYVPDVRMGNQRVIASGYQKDKNTKERICSKCGRWHPNCNCNK